MAKAPINPMTQLNDHKLKKLTLREFVRMQNESDVYWGGPDTIPMSDNPRDWPHNVKDGYTAVQWLTFLDTQWTRTPEVVNGV